MYLLRANTTLVHYRASQTRTSITKKGSSDCPGAANGNIKAAAITSSTAFEHVVARKSLHTSASASDVVGPVSTDRFKLASVAATAAIIYPAACRSESSHFVNNPHLHLPSFQPSLDTRPPRLRRRRHGSRHSVHAKRRSIQLQHRSASISSSTAGSQAQTTLAGHQRRRIGGR